MSSSAAVQHGDHARHRRGVVDVHRAEPAVGDVGPGEHGVQPALEGRSATYRQAPRSKAGSSVRSTRVPRIEPWIGGRTIGDRRGGHRRTLGDRSSTPCLGASSTAPDRRGGSDRRPRPARRDRSSDAAPPTLAALPLAHPAPLLVATSVRTTFHRPALALSTLELTPLVGTLLVEQADAPSDAARRAMRPRTPSTWSSSSTPRR